jgi:hypothetical protein
MLALMFVGVVLMQRQFDANYEAHRNSSERRAEVARQDDEATAEFGESVVRMSLRDPESAQFLGSRVVRKNGKEGVCGFVNAKNGFGGMSGDRPFAVIGGTAIFGDESPAAFKTVADLCFDQPASTTH